MHAVAFWLRRRASLILLEWHHLEWHTEYLGDFLGKLTIVANVITGAAQPASNDLLTQKL